MHNRIPSRRRPDTAARPAARPNPGDTLPAQGETQDPVARLPHERDESADSQPRAEPSAERLGRIAHADATSDQVDTDRGPVLDAAYQKTKRPT